jgi:hypothetical protein
MDVGSGSCTYSSFVRGWCFDLQVFSLRRKFQYEAQRGLYLLPSCSRMKFLLPPARRKSPPLSRTLPTSLFSRQRRTRNRSLSRSQRAWLLTHTGNGGPIRSPGRDVGTARGGESRFRPPMADHSSCKLMLRLQSAMKKCPVQIASGEENVVNASCDTIGEPQFFRCRPGPFFPALNPQPPS